MNFDLTNPIHTVSPKTIRNIVYKHLADRYKIDNLRKYIEEVRKECLGRPCTINDIVEEVEKRIAYSPTALKEKHKRGRPLNTTTDELANLFKRSVQVTEVEPNKGVVRVSASKTGTTTKPLKNSSDELSKSFKKSLIVTEVEPEPKPESKTKIKLRRTVKAVRRIPKVRSTKKVEPPTKPVENPIKKSSSSESQPRKMTRTERATRRATQKDASDLASMLTKVRF